MERKYPVNDSLFSPTKGIICTVNVTYSEPGEIWAQKKCSSGGKIKNTTLKLSNNSVCKQNKWFDFLGIWDTPTKFLKFDILHCVLSQESSPDKNLYMYLMIK